MASVWCAEDLVLGRLVAIKILADRFASDDMAVRRFKREARAAARVATHPHVVTIYDVGDIEGAGERDGRAFIVMEHLAGGTVADALRVGAVRRREAVRWLREAASAMDFAHGHGIVHRDIKPANFLLDRSRVLHVADFGIARLVSEDTITTAGELFGTAAYLSPEQALGIEATGASDRYALAVAGFELLAGERPFTAVHFTAQARQHIEDDRPRASDRDRTLPPALDDVLAQGMAKDPEERFATAGEMVMAIESALAGVPVVAARAPARPAASSRPAAPRREPASLLSGGGLAPSGRMSPLRRHVGRAIALAALAVAAVGVGFVALTGGRAAHHGTPLRTTSTLRATAPKPVNSASTAAASRARRRAADQATTTSTPTSTGTTTALSAEELQATGHQEMLAGNYQTAIQTLRAAVSAAPPNSLTYAYGLYDLGRTLVLAGDPGGAVPILEQRLKIPNQTGVVRQMLDEALRASGQVPAQLQSTSGGQSAGGSGSGTSPGSGHGKGATGTAGTTGTTGTTGSAGTSGSTGGGSGSAGSSGGGSGAGSGGAGLAPQFRSLSTFQARVPVPRTQPAIGD
jgi:serine/threonine-protein kinase